MGVYILSRTNCDCFYVDQTDTSSHNLHKFCPFQYYFNNYITFVSYGNNYFKSWCIVVHFMLYWFYNSNWCAFITRLNSEDTNSNWNCFLTHRHPCGNPRNEYLISLGGKYVFIFNWVGRLHSVIHKCITFFLTKPYTFYTHIWNGKLIKKYTRVLCGTYI